MAIKLDEFRLESYDERLILIMALSHYEGRVNDIPALKAAFDNVARRLSRTQCQDGGCSLCGGGPDD